MRKAGGGLYSVMSRRHSAWCIDKSRIVGSVPYHVVVVVFQEHVACISVVVQDLHESIMGLLIVSSKECVNLRGLIVIRL